MNSRTLTFVAAAVLLAGIRFFLAWSRRRGRPLFTSQVTGAAAWNSSQLLLASFLTLFAELAFIRWIAVEVRVFAYFKNLALLLCFVGFGLGCALAGKAVRWRLAITAFLGLVLVIRIPWQRGGFLEHISQSLGAAPDVEIWRTGNVWNWAHFLLAALCAEALFLLLVFVFVPLGQIVSRQIDLAANSLAAYSLNLVGSLAGILAFLAVSRLMLPPAVWLGMVLAGFALLQTKTADRMLLFSVLVPLVLLLHGPSTSDNYSVWTPYQQIEYSRIYAANRDFTAGLVTVNHTGYQAIINLSPDFLARHPHLLEVAADEHPYDLPFRFATPAPTVMIVGSGTGNDIAGALRHNSSLVDAVEIDPAILALGRREHPEHPYESPRVFAHLTDARAFLKRSPLRYDLILFGLLDSHTQLSDYSNMRIDNFVYTLESFQEAKAHLAPNGVLFVKFQVSHPWMSRRLQEMLQQTFGKPPLIFYAAPGYGASATCFAISPGGRVEQALAADPRLARFVQQNLIVPKAAAVPMTTDDWPYLYQQERAIPRTYLSLAALVMLMALALYMQIPEARQQAPSLFFFSMGAGFLLLETQVISRLALYFGTTWQVNGIVISAMLTALLVANVVIDRSRKPLSRSWALAGLLAGLALAFFFPFSRIPGSPSAVGVLAAAIFSVPVFFAGLLFSLEFRSVTSPSAALGANILGAVAGGLLENLSLMIGMHALLLVTMGLYALAGAGLSRRTEAVRLYSSSSRNP
ncbi:MAG: spermidine synthase [Terriglobales bacterium]